MNSHSARRVQHSAKLNREIERVAEAVACLRDLRHVVGQEEYSLDCESVRVEALNSLAHAWNYLDTLRRFMVDSEGAGG